MHWVVENMGQKGTWTWVNITHHHLYLNDPWAHGFVREDKRPGHGFTPYTRDSDGRAQFPTQDTLEAAKAMLLAHVVANKLEGI
jgi:hypothetical protein